MNSPEALNKILSCYDLAGSPIIIERHGNGLINNTWKVTAASSEYILQRINDSVFKEPANIENNIHHIAAYLKINHPGYLFVSPAKTKSGKEMLYEPGQGYFRLFPFIKNSHTVDVAGSAQQAFEAASQFGLFTKMLAGFPVNSLKITLPGFHDLSLRFRQFQDACTYANAERIKQASAAIEFIQAHEYIVKKFQELQTDPHFKRRVTHHDTKISNVLFDKNGKGLCVIDLDTVMPGYFISDVGDMMRTYLSPVSEEEKDFDKIEIREDFFRAIFEGYMQHMSGELSEEELKHFVYAGKFMIYMQAVRFLTDHLNNDTYYGAKYEGHNYIRACNQITLLQRVFEKESLLNKIVSDYLLKCTGEK